MLRHIIIVLIAIGILTSHLVADECIAPSGATRVNSLYLPDSNGTHWLIDNWRDSNSNTLAQAGDYFNFRDEFGQAVQISDPTILYLQSASGNWFYITGSTNHPTYSNTNFVIYRTRDFRFFEPHMFAFDYQNRNGSQQFLDGSSIHIQNDRYWQLWAPAFLFDPDPADQDPPIHLFFAAIENHEPSAQTDGVQDYHSVYRVSIRKSEFLSWHGKNPFSDDGRRFDDARSTLPKQRQLGYRSPTTGLLIFDGGYSRSKTVACTASAAMVGPNCGQLQLLEWGKQHRCVGGHTAMFIDPFVYVDSSRPMNGAWRNGLVYTWNQHDANIGYDFWGENIAAIPLAQDRVSVRHDVNALFLAYSRNQTPGLLNYGLRHNGTTGSYDNGAMDMPCGPTCVVQETPFTAVAEGPCVFVNKNNNFVYFIYTRNFWTSPGYQLVYRKVPYLTGSNPAALPQLAMNVYSDKTVPEKLVLKAADQSTAGARNFGHAEAFSLRDPTFSTSVPYRYYLALHCKLDQSPTHRRTVIFKELTFDSEGDIVPLVDGGSNPASNVWKFIVPVCRDPSP